MTDPWSYLTVVLVSVLSVLPRLIVLVSKNEIRPNAWFQLRHHIFNEPRKSVWETHFFKKKFPSSLLYLKAQSIKANFSKFINFHSNTINKTLKSLQSSHIRSSAENFILGINDKQCLSFMRLDSNLLLKTCYMIYITSFKTYSRFYSAYSKAKFCISIMCTQNLITSYLYFLWKSDDLVLKYIYYLNSFKLFLKILWFWLILKIN